MRKPKRARAKVSKTWPVKMLIGIEDTDLEERKVNETVDFYVSLGCTSHDLQGCIETLHTLGVVIRVHVYEPRPDRGDDRRPRRH